MPSVSPLHPRSDLVLHQLSKKFPNGTVGLEPTTLTITAGEYFVLCGQSGSGKSTLLRLIAGLEQPTTGTINIGGQEVQHWLPHQRNIAFVPQRAALYPQRDIAGNISIGLELEQIHRPRAERLTPVDITKRVRDAAEQLRIAHLLKNRADQVSGGEAKRVMLARALVRQAPLWLLDEPLGQLDTALAEKLSEDLHLLQRLLNLTIIHVTHDPSEAMALADRVGLLDGGSILQLGKPTEIYARPSSRTVGLHFGRPVIHLIDGVSDGEWFVSNDQFIKIQTPRVGIVTLGVRIEDVVFETRPGFTPVGEGTVQHCQPMGQRWLVSVGSLRGMWDGEPPTLGTKLTVTVREERLHWFDAAGKRIEE